MKNPLSGPEEELAKRISLNTLWLFVGRVGVQGALIIVTIFIARRMGETGLGQYAFIASTIYLANILSTFGTDILLIREIAADRDFSSVLSALLLQLVLSVGFIVLTLISAPLLPNQSDEAAAALQLFSFSLIPTAFYVVFSAALRGYERMDVFTALNFAAALAQVAAIWLFIRPGSSIVLLAGLLLITQIFSAALAAGLVFIYLPDAKRILTSIKKPMRQLMRASAPIASFAILGVFYQRLSVYLVAILSGAAATGLFSAAMRVVEAPKVVHIALLGALFPAMSQAHAQATGGREHAPFGSAFSLSAGGLFAIATLAAIALFFFAEPIILLLYGGRFAQAAIALKILCWALIPFTASQYIATKFLAQGREKQVVIALFASIAVLFTLTIWALPRWGIGGAAWAVLFAEAAQAGVFLFLQKRRGA